MTTAYRREIDGLRAIAVLAVVCFHAGLGPIAGFAGVDVFFVISGYLITSLLLRERDATGRIDLPAFYARRMRRILPAALVVVVLVLAVAQALLLPEVHDAVAQSASAAALFVANIFFQQQTSGYFSADAGQMPLLHLWSLAVEEQFYLAWPALLLLIPRARLRPVLVVLVLASFVLTQALLWGNPSAAFFQMPARFWELGVGGLVAMQSASPRPRWLAWAGLVLLLGSMLVVPMQFPGFGALPAVLGSAMVLLAVHSGQRNAFLASAPMVGLGLVSYGLYLWHWPLLTLDRMIRVGPAPLATRLMLLAGALVLAIASYRYLETPLRRMRTPPRRVLGASALLLAVLSAGAWLSRPPPPPVGAPAFAVRCGSGPGPLAAMQNRNCLGREPKVVIWGDSYAFAWTPMAQVLATRMRMPATNLARDGCPPLLEADLVLRSPAEERACLRWNRNAIEWLRTHGADTLIIVGRWERWIEPDDANDGAAALLRSIHAASPYVRRILVIAPTPVLDDFPAKCAALHSDCSVSRAVFESNAAPAWRAIDALGEDPKVTVTDPAQWLCDPHSCPGIRNGEYLYNDLSHISGGAALIWGKAVGKDWR